jgi:hypothetical protein
MPKMGFRASRLAGWAALAFVPLLAATGCGREDDSFDEDDPPDHIIKAPKSQGKYRFGITDTIAIEFSEDIDTAALDLDFSDPDGIGWRLAGTRRALVYGTRSTFGTAHFTVNTPFTLTLTGLRDRAGNGQGAIEAEFAPYPWADRDYLDSTFDWSDSLYADTTWLDGTPISDSLIIEGALDDKQNVGRVDRRDFKLIRVAAPDTLYLGLTTRPDLNLRMHTAGPFRESQLDSVIRNFDFNAPIGTGEGSRVQTRDSTMARGRASSSLVTDLFDHKSVLGSFDARGVYVVWLRVPEEKEGFYRLGVRIGRKYK